MTPQAKKWAVVGAVLLVLGIGAAVFMQQATARIEAEARAALSTLPNVQQSSVEGVKFDFFGQTLTLKNLKLAFKDGKGTSTSITAAEVALMKPNFKLLQGDTSAGLLLAEEVSATQYVTTVSTPKPMMKAESRVEKLRVVRPEGDYHSLLAIDANGKALDPVKALKALETLKIAGLYYEKISVDLNMAEIPPVRMSMDSMEGKSFSSTFMEACTVKDFAVDVKGMGKLSLGAMEIHALTLPDLSKMPPKYLTEDSQEMTQQEAEALLQAIMPKGKALLGSLVLRDMQEGLSGDKVSFKTLALKNIWLDPAQGEIATEELSIPATLIPNLVTQMLGYQRFDISGNVAVHPTKDKLVQLLTNLDVKDAGKLHLSIEMENPMAAGTASMQDVDKLLLANLAFSYADKGLISRSMRLVKNSMNMEPEAVLMMARATAKEVVGNNPQNVQQFMNFMEKPGEITIAVTPARPVPMGKAEELMQSDAVRVTSVPGPKTLQELFRQ